MKTLRKKPFKRGFTLMELMVAMAITSIIVTVLVSITSIALDTWNRSRAELRAARQAKSMVETMARDFESMVTRRGNDFEWLSAIAPPSAELPGENLVSTNSTDLVFFSAATDRYGGEIRGTEDKGGDVSCVGYRLHYRNPIDKTGNEFETFVLNRYLVNPDKTFTDLLGKTDLKAAFVSFSDLLDEEKNFVCENVFQFTLTFHVEVTREVSGTDKLVTVPVTVGQSTAGQMTDSFKIKGAGIEVTSENEKLKEELAAGQLTAVEVSVTVISDYGVDQLRSRPFSGSQEPELMTKNSYHYSKLITLPRM